MINQLQDFQVIIFLAFFNFIRWTQYRQQGGGGRERGEGTRQRVLLKPRPAVLSRMACGRSLNALS